MAVDDDEVVDEDPSWIGCLRSNGDRVYAAMSINGNNISFQIDTGAEVNTITKCHVTPADIRKTSHRLITWNKTKIMPLGEATLDVVNPMTDTAYSVNFVVVPDNLTCLLSLRTSEEMGIVTLNSENFRIAAVTKTATYDTAVSKTATADTRAEITQRYPEVFDSELGKLPGTVKLHLKKDYEPKVLPCRRIPFAIQSEVKTELDRLVDLGVLAPVSEPTEWVNQMAVARKKNGSMRLCIDPAHLNAALLREHYQLPTLDDVLDKFSGSKVFSKLDVKSAYWHLELDETSSLLTTMITPFGRFRWLRLPFGLCVSSEIFQRHLSQALDGLQGVACIADDLALMGKDDDNHADRLHKLLSRCSEKGIKLNSSPDKLQLKCEEIHLHGHIFTTNGIKPDPTKVQGINDMPIPEDASAVRRFCGMIQYLARFLPNLAQTAAPLRQLTRNDAEWIWTEEHTTAFNTLKKMAAEAPLLGHYDPKAPITLQTDASSHGLGATLLQDSRPIAYASRALTPTEQRYAQIEKECLSVVYGLERFDQYTYGRPVNVEAVRNANG